MQASSSTQSQSYRGVQRNPRPGTAAYMQGKKQATLSLQRYHILCAAIQKKYMVCDTKPVVDRREGIDLDPIYDCLYLPRISATIDFSAYGESKLHPIKNVELVIPYPSGAIDDIELQIYDWTVRDDWRMREGGVLYALAEYSEFFTCMLNYHSPENSTGVTGWDSLFENLRNSGYRKNIVPCMFFGQNEGCLDRNCPFLHDREATIADRAKVLEQRRKTFDYKHHPTYRQSMIRQVFMVKHLSGGNEALEREIQESEQLAEDMQKDKAYCANPRCMRPWKKGEEHKPLKVCKRCKYTMYCSHECQKADWPRHKKDPCAPIEDIVQNDDLWHPIGTRKGASFFKTHRDSWMRRFHADA